MIKLEAMVWTTIGFLTLVGCGPGGEGARPEPSVVPAGTEKSAKVELTPGQEPARKIEVLPSGIRYSIVKEGHGAPPPVGSKLVAHVRGWISGKPPFLDTKARGKPLETKLDKLQLIAGLFESFAAMRTGELRRVWVPSVLGYGTAGYEGQVPPGTDLDFDLELLSYEP